MLDKDIVSGLRGGEFQSSVGEYFVNMTGYIRTLHKTNCKSCPHSSWAYSFISFNSLKEVEEYEKAHKDATPFRRCGNCFKKRNS